MNFLIHSCENMHIKKLMHTESISRTEHDRKNLEINKQITLYKKIFGSDLKELRTFLKDFQNPTVYSIVNLEQKNITSYVITTRNVHVILISHNKIDNPKHLYEFTRNLDDSTFSLFKSYSEPTFTDNTHNLEFHKKFQQIYRSIPGW